MNKHYRAEGNDQLKGVRPAGSPAGAAMAILLVGALALAACSAKGSRSPKATNTTIPATSSSLVSPSASPTTTVAPKSPTTTTKAAQNLTLTAAIRSQLIAAGAATNQIPASEYTGLVPGRSYYAYDPATNTYWAGARLEPSPTSLRAQISVQDDGGYLVFEQPPGGSWTAYDVGLGGVGRTVCSIQVPASVLAVWHWRAGSCVPDNI